MQVKLTLSLAFAAMASVANAQTVPATRAPPDVALPNDAASPIATVTVTAQSQPAYRATIDRKSYGIGKDLQAATGSIGDALKNLPSVSVDVQGNVSLRGDSNVLVMIDGKVSGLFKGPGAALALQSMGADEFERVEVITNPSSDLSSEGTAGIINLITRKTHKPGDSGSVRLNVGTEGRKNVNLNGSYNADKLTLTGDVGARDDGRDQSSTDKRTEFGDLGQQLGASVSDAKGHSGYSQFNTREGAEYSLNNNMEVGGEARYSYVDRTVDATQAFLESVPSDLNSQSFIEPSSTETKRQNGVVQLTFHDVFSGDGNDIKASVDHEETQEARSQVFDQLNIDPASPYLLSRLNTHSHLSIDEFKVDISHSMPFGATLKAGYDFHVDNDFYNNNNITVNMPSTTAGESNNFDEFFLKQTISSAYTTYEQTYQKLTALVGVRLESVHVNINQKTTAINNVDHYLRAYPSIHSAYQIDKNQEFNVSFSKRVQRPSPQDYDPFRSQIDTLDYRQGNPALKPQSAYSYEAGYQLKSGSDLYQATVFYRSSHDVVADVLIPLSNGALLSTKENVDSSGSSGIEFTANGAIFTAVKYNVSATFSNLTIGSTPAELGEIGGAQLRRSVLSSGLNGSISWDFSKQDSLQVNGQLNGKQIVPQGFIDPSIEFFVGYRHKISDSLTALVTIQDLFNSYKFHENISSALLRERSTIDPNSRGIFFGFTWNFGGVRKKSPPPEFDFGGT